MNRQLRESRQSRQPRFQCLKITSKHAENQLIVILAAGKYRFPVSPLKVEPEVFVQSDRGFVERVHLRNHIVMTQFEKVMPKQHRHRFRTVPFAPVTPEQPYAVKEISVTLICLANVDRANKLPLRQRLDREQLWDV